MKYPQMWEELKERIELYQAINWTPELNLVQATMERLEDEYE